MEEVKKDDGTASQNIPTEKAKATGEGITSAKAPKKPRAVAKPNRPEADEAARTDKFDQDSANLEEYPLWALGAKGRKCVEAIAKTKLAHPILVATNLLGLMAGCAQEHADACPAQDSALTRMPLSLYTIGLAKSSEGKTLSMETLSAGIYRYDDVADKEYEKAQKEYKVARAYYVGELKRWKKRHQPYRRAKFVSPERAGASGRWAFHFRGRKSRETNKRAGIQSPLRSDYQRLRQSNPSVLQYGGLPTSQRVKPLV